jgi:hypothetical protein
MPFPLAQGVFDVARREGLDNEKSSCQWVFCNRFDEVRELPLRRKELPCQRGAHSVLIPGNLQRGKVCCPHCKSMRELSYHGLETDGPPR